MASWSKSFADPNGFNVWKRPSVQHWYQRFGRCGSKTTPNKFHTVPNEDPNCNPGISCSWCIEPAPVSPSWWIWHPQSTRRHPDWIGTNDELDFFPDMCPFFAHCRHKLQPTNARKNDGWIPWNCATKRETQTKQYGDVPIAQYHIEPPNLEVVSWHFARQIGVVVIAFLYEADWCTHSVFSGSRVTPTILVGFACLFVCIHQTKKTHGNCENDSLHMHDICCMWYWLQLPRSSLFSQALSVPDNGKQWRNQKEETKL